MASGCPVRTLSCAVCLALWTCAGAAGPVVLTLSVCVLRVPATPFSVCTGTTLIRHAMFSGARRRGRVLQQPWCLQSLPAYSAGLEPARTHCMQGVVCSDQTCDETRMSDGCISCPRAPLTGGKSTRSVPFQIEWFTCPLPFSRLYWHDPGSARYAFGCPAPWTCAAAAGPTVLAPSACVLSRMCAGCQAGSAAIISGRSRRYWQHP